MIWAEALELIKQGKKLRAVDWLPGCYCCLDEIIRLDILGAKPDDPLRRWMPFDFIVCRPLFRDGTSFRIHTGDTIGEWELYD